MGISKNITSGLSRLFHSLYLPDTLYLKIIFRKKLGYPLCLRRPRTFNEKIQWLKLYDRRPKYRMLVDKYEVKKFVKDRIGEQYVIPTLGLWDRPSEIDFESLPGQFVLKCTHDSGSVVICRDKTQFKKEAAEEKLNRRLGRNYFWHGREWPYKNLPRKIIGEKYMTDESGTELKDYKVFTFSGKAQLIEVDFDRFTNHKCNYYTPQWEYLPIAIGYPPDPSKKIRKPAILERLLSLAEELAKTAGSPAFLRVDMYVAGPKIYFGEFTFYPGNGFEKILPEEWDRKLGDLIVLPTVKRKGKRVRAGG